MYLISMLFRLSGDSVAVLGRTLDMSVITLSGVLFNGTLLCVRRDCIKRAVAFTLPGVALACFTQQYDADI